MQTQTPTGKISATVTSAFVRAGFLAVVAFGLATLTTRQQEVNGVPLSWEQCLIAGGISGLGILMARGLGEGGLDAGRQADGNVSPADVQPNPPKASDRVDRIGTPGGTVQRIGGR